MTKKMISISNCELFNIPATPAYGVFISQLIQYSIACGSYHGVRDRGLLLTKNLLNQGFLLVELKSPLLKVLRSPPCPGEQLLNICVTIDHVYVQFVVLKIRSFPNSWLITGFATKVARWVTLVEQDIPTLSEHLSSTPVFRVIESLVFCVVLWRSMFVFWSFLIFFEWRLLVLLLYLKYFVVFFQIANVECCCLMSVFVMNIFWKCRDYEGLILFETCDKTKQRHVLFVTTAISEQFPWKLHVGVRQYQILKLMA